MSGHSDQKGIFLATAHPVKFPDVIKNALGMDPVLPDAAKELFTKKSYSIDMKPIYSHLKNWLLNR